jgi:hypothetical protein
VKPHPITSPNQIEHAFQKSSIIPALPWKGWEHYKARAPKEGESTIIQKILIMSNQYAFQSPCCCKNGVIISPTSPRRIGIDDIKSLVPKDVERPRFYVLIRDKPGSASTARLACKLVQLPRRKRYVGQRQRFMKCGQTLLAFPRSSMAVSEYFTASAKAEAVLAIQTAFSTLGSF